MGRGDLRELIVALSSLLCCCHAWTSFLFNDILLLVLSTFMDNFTWAVKQKLNHNDASVGTSQARVLSPVKPASGSAWQRRCYSPLQITWSCSRIPKVFLESHPLEILLSYKLHPFPPWASVAQDLWPHCIPDLFQSSFQLANAGSLLWNQVSGLELKYSLSCRG